MIVDPYRLIFTIVGATEVDIDLDSSRLLLRCLERILDRYFENLIIRYNSAQDHLTRLLASSPEIDDNDIAEADRELNDAFEAIMQAEIRTPLQIFARIEFIAEQINERCEDREIIKKMTDQILDDVSEIVEKTDPDCLDKLERAK